MANTVVLLAAATRIRKVVSSAAVAESKSYVLVATTSPANAAFRIVYESLDLTPVEFQNQAQEKRYQISAAQTTTDGLGAKIAAVINNDKFAPVVATYTAGTDTLLLVAKVAGVKFNIYSSDISFPTATSVTNAALGVNTYDYLKNINWAQNVDFDRNLNYFPLPGVLYDSYYFEVDGAVITGLGGNPVPGEIHNASRNGFKLYVKQGLTLATALNLLVTDLNA